MSAWATCGCTGQPNTLLVPTPVPAVPFPGHVLPITQAKQNMAGVMFCRRFLSPRFISPVCRASSYFSGNYIAPKVEYVSKDYEKLHRQSIEEPETFWGQLAATQLNWIQPFETVMDCDLSSGSHKWFLGGKINVTGNQQC